MYIYIHTHKQLYVNMYICVYIHKYVYVYIYIYLAVFIVKIEWIDISHKSKYIFKYVVCLFSLNFRHDKHVF